MYFYSIGVSGTILTLPSVYCLTTFVPVVSVDGDVAVSVDGDVAVVVNL